MSQKEFGTIWVTHKDIMCAPYVERERNNHPVHALQNILRKVFAYGWHPYTSLTNLYKCSHITLQNKSVQNKPCNPHISQALTHYTTSSANRLQPSPRWSPERGDKWLEGLKLLVKLELFYHIHKIINLTPWRVGIRGLVFFPSEFFNGVTFFKRCIDTD